MNREEAKKLAPFIEAFGNGEDIQISSSTGKWTSVEQFFFSNDIDNCRIKPKPREWIINVDCDGDVTDGYEITHGAGYLRGGIVVREVI